jgi:tetratricopeptide (TPR) repeat protein
MRNWLHCGLVAVVFCVGHVVGASADEIDDALQLETAAGAAVGTPQTNAAAPDQLKAEAAVAVGIEGQPPQAGSPASPAADLPMAQLSRHELESELTAAQAEIVRLKDIVRQILVANRREKESMHYNMGCVMRAAGQYQQAEKAFLDALAINPQDPAVHYNLGVLYDEDLGRPDKAKKHYQVFLNLAPNDVDAGRVYQWLTAIE